MSERVNHLRDIYIQNFLDRSRKNLELAKLSFSVISSQLPVFGMNSLLISKRKPKFNKDSEIRGKITNHVIDTRIHLTYIAPTGTGKTESKAFIIETLNKLNSLLKDEIKINYESVDGSMTDISWVGSKQIRKGKEKEEVVETEGILKKFKNGGIILADEALSILSLLKNKEDKTIYYLNLVMDNFRGVPRVGNYVTRTTVHGTVEYHSFPSIIFLTYIPDKKDFNIEKLFNTGFIQRQILLYRMMTEEERKALSKELIKSIGTSINVNTKEYEYLLKELADVRKYCAKNIGKYIVVRDNSILNDFYNKYEENLIEPYVGMKREFYLNLFNRLIDLIIKFAGGFAVLDKRLRIIRDDLELATDIVLNDYLQPLQYAIDISMKDVIKDPQLYKFAMKIISDKMQNKIFTASELKTYIMSYFKYTEPTFYNKRKEWIKKGYIVMLEGKKYMINVEKIIEDTKL